MARPKSAVLIVTPSTDFHPTHVHQTPERIDDARWLMRHLTLDVAIKAARQFNMEAMRAKNMARHLGNDAADRIAGWALPVASVKQELGGYCWRVKLPSKSGERLDVPFCGRRSAERFIEQLQVEFGIVATLEPIERQGGAR